MKEPTTKRCYCVMDYSGEIIYQGHSEERAAELWKGERVVGQADSRNEAWRDALKLRTQARASMPGNVKIRKIAENSSESV